MTELTSLSKVFLETIDQVRKLHFDMSADCNCRDCTAICNECSNPYPCDTIQIIDGE